MTSSPLRHTLCLLATIFIGLGSRRVYTGVFLFDKSLGDMAYAAAVFWLLRLARFPTAWAATASLAVCLAIETFKITGLPAAWSGIPASRLLLGSTPSWHNVLCYAGGIVVATSLDIALGYPRNPA